jgi:hypothetical protein
MASGKLSHNYGKSPLFMGKLTISMAIFHSSNDLTVTSLNCWRIIRLREIIPRLKAAEVKYCNLSALNQHLNHNKSAFKSQ